MEKCCGYCVYRGRGFALGGHGALGVGIRKTRTPPGGAGMSTTEIFYVLGTMVSAALLVYLVYALICAEEF